METSTVRYDQSIHKEKLQIGEVLLELWLEIKIQLKTTFRPFWLSQIK